MSISQVKVENLTAISAAFSFQPAAAMSQQTPAHPTLIFGRNYEDRREPTVISASAAAWRHNGKSYTFNYIYSDRKERTHPCKVTRKFVDKKMKSLQSYF